MRRAYGLTIDRREAAALDRILTGCASTALEPVVCEVPTGSSGPAGGATRPDALARYDDNRNGSITCAEARRHGIAPVRRSHPAYRYMRDADADGVACEQRSLNAPALTMDVAEGTTMANQEHDHRDGVTREDISEAYGDLHTRHQEGSLTRHEMEGALRAAAADIYRCTVAITTMLEDDEIGNASFDDLRPGTGVLVQSSGVHGILTAAHVLGGKGKTKRYEQDRCTIGILPLQGTRTRSSDQAYFRIRRRRCLAYGVQNEDADGPDLAYIPLTPREWALLEPDGVRAWTPLDEPDPGMPRNTKAEILLDCCLGPNHKATRRLQEEHPEARPAIAFQALQVLELTRARTEVGDWDYTKFTLEGDDREGAPPAAPRRTPEQTYRDFLDYEWHQLRPRDMLGGLSGTGLWTARIRVNAIGDMRLHAKRLKGVLFYAGPGLDATLHGKNSIRRIITQGLDLHGQAAMDEAEALKEAERRA